MYAVRNVDEPGEDDIIPSAVVAMTCPTCGKAYTVHTLMTAAKAPPATRKAALAWRSSSSSRAASRPRGRTR